MSFCLRYVACLILCFLILFKANASLPREGGVSGGGGNVLNPQVPSRPMESECAEHVVRASLAYTRLFFAHAKKQYQAGQASPEVLSVYQRLFEGQKDIGHVLAGIQPHVYERGPCFDYDLKPVDASIISQVPNRFCISSYALSRKVQPEAIPVQAAALMAHEYTEIMGLEETDAIIIQKQALQDLQRADLPPLSVRVRRDSN